jgi:hypothetical protein
MPRRLLPWVLAGAVAMGMVTPARAWTHGDPNDVKGDRYDIAATSLKVASPVGGRRMILTIRTYEGFKLALGEGAFDLWLDSWGAGKADYRLTMVGDPASGGMFVAKIRSLHGPWYEYDVRLSKTGARTIEASFPARWIHHTKAVRWHVRSRVPAFPARPGIPVVDRAPDVGRYPL